MLENIYNGDVDEFLYERRVLRLQLYKKDLRNVELYIKINKMYFE